MKSFKTLINSLREDPNLRQLTDEEVIELRKIFIETYKDLVSCCEKYNLTVMLIGGTVIGAVRHKGFIPWDDDLDVAMPRADFEKLKRVFESELGEKYTLSSPNYKGHASNRFPKMLVKNTLFVEAGGSRESETSKIKIDIFVVENVPDNKIIRTIKGLWVTGLMFMASREGTYESRHSELKTYMCKTDEGRKYFNRMVRWGRLFSFFNHQKWMDIVDKACQYKKETKLMGIPTGRGHYFGEIRPRKTFIPVSKGLFEGLTVNLPGNPDDYISHLYGSDYMTLPPVEKRERHLIVDIKFKGEV